MSRAGRPAAVLRYLHRPLWWIGGVALFLLLLLATDARSVQEENARFADSFEVTGSLVAPWDGEDRLLDVEYPSPVTGKTVRAATYVRNSALVPTPGSTPLLEVSRADPSIVQLFEDRQEITDELPLYLAGIALALAFLAARHWHIHRTERLMRAEGASFAMLGAILPPSFAVFRWRLFLYPVDAVPGSAPVCSFSLITVPTVASGVFPVEVKGSPRPFGAVAVRSGDEVLWTRGRAGPRAVWPRPEATGVFRPTLPKGVSPPPGRLPSAWVARLLVIASLLVFAGYLWTNADALLAQKQVLDRSRPVKARVVDSTVTGGRSATATIEYDADGSRESATLTIRNQPAGKDAVVDVRYDPADPTRVWEQGNDYPPGSGSADVVFFFLLAFVPLALMLAARMRGLRAVQVGARELLTYGRVDRGVPPAGTEGLTFWEGALAVRVPSYRGWRTGSLSRTVLRFVPRALVSFDAAGRPTEHRWDDGSQSLRPNAAPSPQDLPPDLSDEGRWVLTSYGDSHRELEIRLLSDARSRPLPGQNNARSGDAPRRYRLPKGTSSAPITALAEFLCRTPRAREGLADPGRVIALVAYLACRPSAGAAIERFTWLDDGGRSND